MKTIEKMIISLLSVAAVTVNASVDNAPISAGMTTGRNMLGTAPEAPAHNPALLGCERPPLGGLLVFPITNYGMGIWSDKLAISPSTFFGHYPNDSAGVCNFIKAVMRNSCDLSDDPDKNSEKITDKFKGGASIYSGYRMSLLSFAQHRVAFDITTHADEEVHIPEAPFYFFASPDKGLQQGNTLDFGDFNQEGIWATDFAFQLGLPVKIPVLHNLFKLRLGAGGVGLKYIMGHSMLRAWSSSESAITYDTANGANVLRMDGTFTVQTAGMGLHGPWTFDKGGPFSQGFPVNGHGVGVDVGGILYDETGAMSINLQNLGVLFWTKNAKSKTYNVKKPNINMFDLITAIDKYKNDPDSCIAHYFGGKDEAFITHADSLENTDRAILTVLPLSLNIGYSRIFDLKRTSNQHLQSLGSTATLAANYEQQLAPGPGRSFIPRLSIGSELLTLRDFVPVRMGFVAGGPEHWASAFGLGFKYRYFSIHAAYKAIGNWWFYPSRGFELAGGLNVNWGFTIDSDKDGIVDTKDECPSEPEDIDGFEDEDGCPDYDNDKDGILDVNDRCPDKPEDKDGFEDQDGCPDRDNDFDGVSDSLDKCPNVAEDRDNFQDQDGCPDFDNDADGVPDSTDKCPIHAEDIDLFEDDDGCPDFDNDKDGIADSLDRCINEPESFNGFRDEDGCPDTLIKPTLKEMQVLNTKLRGVNFKTASAELLPESFVALDYTVGFLRQYPNLRYEIQGHTDIQGGDDYNLLLSAARAGTVRAYLLSKGITDSSLIAIGYGKAMPIADNKTTKGRALNRRVEFRYIESNQEYSSLKMQEMMFRERVRGAKIKGAQY